VNGSGFSLKRIALNAVSISGGEVANKAATFMVYAMISRSGIEAFGQLALGLTLLYTFQVFGQAGLPTVLARLIAKRRLSARRLLLHGYLVSVATGLLAGIVMVLLALALQYQSGTTWVICVLALAVPVYSLTMVVESVIRGREQMHLIPVGNLPGNILLVIGSWLVIQWGVGPIGVAGVVLLSRLVTFGHLHLLLWRATGDCQPGKIRWDLCTKLLGKAGIFLGSDGVAAIGASLAAMILSKFATEREVGMLSAAFQLLQPLQIVYRSVGHSAFPQLVVAGRSGAASVAALAHRILSQLVRVAFPASLTMMVVAPDLLDLVYGHKGFREGAFVLQIVALTLLFDPLNPVLGHGLWAVGADRSVFRLVLVNVLFNLGCGLILIGKFGLIGAAITAVATSLLNVCQHYAMFSRYVASPGLLSEILKLTPAILLAVAVVFQLPWPTYANLAVALVVYVFITLLARFTQMQFWPSSPGHSAS
jgi:O-antigen/teichoic acid export membrane protein